MKDGTEIPLIDFDDVFEGAGFIMARKGRFVFSQSTLSKDEHQDFLKELRDGTKDAEKSIEKQVLELEAILQQYNPFDILANIFIMNSIRDIETYKEYEHSGVLAFIEYLALLLLTKPFEYYSERRLEHLSGEVIEDIQERIHTLFTNQIFFLAFKDINPDAERPSPLQELRFMTLTQSLLVRVPAYYHHSVELTKDLFEPLKEELYQSLKFDINDFFIVANVIENITVQRFIERGDEGARFTKKLKKAVKLYRHKKRITEKFEEEMLKTLAELSSKESESRINNMITAWMFLGIGDTFSFTVDDIISETGIEPDRIINILERFSIGFGEVNPDYYRVPAPTHPLTIKPIIRQGQKYICPVPQLLHSGVRQAIEEMINPDISDEASSSLWNQYRIRRANFIEDKAIEYLEQALVHAKVYKNLKYHIIEDGKEKEVELDGLLQLDSLLFLVEVKAGNLSLSARRGAPKRMVRDLESLVEEAYSQALRAKNYLIDTENPVFTLSDGELLHIKNDEHEKIFMITITLEHLEAFITNLYKLKDIGFMKDGDYPWAVSLNDLRVISEISATSSEFVHFLFRRNRINELGIVRAVDELDWYGHYLQEGLYFEDDAIPKNKLNFSLLSYTTPFDDYYFYATGKRKTPAKKPRQKMPEIIKKIIETFEREHPKGYLKATKVLLDMGIEARNDFAKLFSRMEQEALSDGKHHDFSMPFLDANMGIACMFCTMEKEHELLNRLANYCIIKKYALNIKTWVGFGFVVDSGDSVSVMFVHDSVLEQNDELDKSLEKMPFLRNITQ